MEAIEEHMEWSYGDYLLTDDARRVDLAKTQALLLERQPGMTCTPCQIRPESRGTVHLRSRDATAYPAIVPNYLGDPADQRAAIAGMKFTRRIMSQPALAPYLESAADGFGDSGVFAFGVARNVDTAAERDRAGVEALRQGRLAGADDPCENEVGRGDQAAGVEHPRVVDEGAAGVEVLADEHAVAAESTFGQEWVGASQGGGGVLVAGES